MRLLRVLLVGGCVAVQAMGLSGVAQKPSFEVTTVKPAKPDEQGQHWSFHNNQMEVGNYTLTMLLKAAYDLKTDAQVLQAPEWVGKEHYDLSAKLDEAEYKKLDRLSGPDEEKEMEALLQSMLLERFHLSAHTEMRAMGVLALVQDKKGAKLIPLKPLPPKEDGTPTEPPHNTSVHDGHMETKGADMRVLAEILSGRYETGKRVVLDRTGLPGYFDFTLDWTPDRGAGISPEATKPDLTTALMEQLGLRLEKQDAEVPVLVVESVARPDFD